MSRGVARPDLAVAKIPRAGRGSVAWAQASCEGSLVARSAVRTLSGSRFGHDAYAHVLNRGLCLFERPLEVL